MAIVFGVRSIANQFDGHMWFDRHDDGKFGFSLTGDFSKIEDQIDFDDMDADEVEELIAFLRVKKPKQDSN